MRVASAIDLQLHLQMDQPDRPLAAEAAAEKAKAAKPVEPAKKVRLEYSEVCAPRAGWSNPFSIASY